jgi:hypothetical protein
MSEAGEESHSAWWNLPVEKAKEAFDDSIRLIGELVLDESAWRDKKQMMHECKVGLGEGTMRSDEAVEKYQWVKEDMEDLESVEAARQKLEDLSEDVEKYIASYVPRKNQADLKRAKGQVVWMKQWLCEMDLVLRLRGVVVGGVSAT